MTGYRVWAPTFEDEEDGIVFGVNDELRAADAYIESTDTDLDDPEDWDHVTVIVRDLVTSNIYQFKTAVDYNPEVYINKSLGQISESDLECL